MKDKNGLETGYRDDVSPYLQRPLRSFAQACRDIAARRHMLRSARIANDNMAIFRVAPTGAALRRGDA